MSSSRLSFVYKGINGVRRILIKENIDMVFTLGERLNFITILSAVGIRTKVVASNRASPLFSLMVKYVLLNGFSYRLADGLVFQTTLAREMTRNLYGNVQSKVIPNGLEIKERIQKKPKDIILNVGNFNRGKNQDKLINIFSRVNKKFTNKWELHFVGSGPTLNYCINMAETLGLSDRIVFHGSKSNIQDLYLNARIFAFVSESEGFPNVILEALAYKCPVIAYDCIAGPSDVLQNGYNGYLVRLNDDQEFALKLMKLMQREDILHSIAQNCIKSVEQYDIKRVAKEYLSFFERLL